MGPIRYKPVFPTQQRAGSEQFKTQRLIIVERDTMAKNNEIIYSNINEIDKIIKKYKKVIE